MGDPRTRFEYNAYGFFYTPTKRCVQLNRRQSVKKFIRPKVLNTVIFLYNYGAQHINNKTIFINALRRSKHAFLWNLNFNMTKLFRKLSGKLSPTRYNFTT